ncbi:hypothetical protein B0H15DRAFT_1025558 [Mycena belliarum]|uniref:Uncharacterized protein n=1 Tax=Mycena belliarum TaxID=1033014 RepID=A0AAD6XHE8_9AGAR|nr:hypothetical protein B0H15DRAFT_1025558 [Mycena belliae]
MEQASPLQHLLPTRLVTPSHTFGSPAGQVLNSSPETPIPHSRRRNSFILTCGAELPWSSPSSTNQGASNRQPCSVPFLPIPLDDSPPSAGNSTRSTGCGATIHTRATPRGVTTWLGDADGVGWTAIPLPSEYFTDDQRCQLGGGPRSQDCGCAATGIGCRICGNTLGVRQTVCRAHRAMGGAAHAVSYTFLGDAVSPPIPRRRKIPATLVSRSRMPTRIYDFGNWVVPSARPREGSPAPMGRTTRALRDEPAQEDGRFGIEAMFAQDRGVSHIPQHWRNGAWGDYRLDERPSSAGDLGVLPASVWFRPDSRQADAQSAVENLSRRGAGMLEEC